MSKIRVSFTNSKVSEMSAWIAIDVNCHSTWIAQHTQHLLTWEQNQCTITVHIIVRRYRTTIKIIEHFLTKLGFKHNKHLRSFECGTTERSLHHCLVHGIDGCPRKRTADHNAPHGVPRCRIRIETTRSKTFMGSATGRGALPPTIF